MDKRTRGGVIILAVLFSFTLFTGNIFASDVYKIDPTHSTFGFAVRHMQVGVTRGVFTDYQGEIRYDQDNLDNFQAWVIIKTDSVDTRLAARDKHLRGADFFDVENYPTIVFRAKKLLKKGDGYEIIGDLTMRGVTKEVSGPVAIRGPAQSPFGGEIIGLSGETVINRQDYGISWNDKMPDGGFVVGNDVQIIIDFEADKK